MYMKYNSFFDSSLIVSYDDYKYSKLKPSYLNQIFYLALKCYFWTIKAI